MEKIKVGDRIIASESCGDLSGKTGKVILIKGYAYGIRFDEFINGHSLDGNCENGYGWWIFGHKFLEIAGNPYEVELI